MPSSFPTSRDVLANPSAADQKNSATVPHASQHANANDAIEAIEAALPITSEGSVPRGARGYAQTITAQTGITTETDLTSLSLTVSAGTSRRLRISAGMRVAVSVANDGAHLRIKEGTTQLGDALITLPVAGRAGALVANAIVTPSAGNHTYKLTLARFAGTGTVDTDPDTGSPAWLLVEDIGAV